MSTRRVFGVQTPDHTRNTPPSLWAPDRESRGVVGSTQARLSDLGRPRDPLTCSGPSPVRDVVSPRDDPHHPPQLFTPLNIYDVTPTGSSPGSRKRRARRGAAGEEGGGGGRGGGWATGRGGRGLRQRRGVGWGRQRRGGEGGGGRGGVWVAAEECTSTPKTGGKEKK